MVEAAGAQERERNARPDAWYRHRLDAARMEMAGYRRRFSLVAWVRLFLFAGGAVAVWGAAAAGWWPGWVAVAIGGFLVAVAVHHRLAGRIAHMERVVAYREAGVARTTGAPWSAPACPLAPPADHPFAQDLDVLGDDSLFSLLCTAGTTGARETLGRWLLEPPTDPAVIRARQEAVRELAQESAFREQLACQIAEGDTMDARALLTWAERPERVSAAQRRWRHGLYGAVGAAATAAVAAAFVWNQAAVPAVVLVTAVWALGRWHKKDVAAMVAGAQAFAQKSATLGELARLIGQRRAAAPLLQQLCRDLDGDPPAWRELERFGRLVRLWQQGNNQVVAPLAFLWLWTPHIALRMEAWRVAHRDQVRRWLDAVFAYEALASLATYAFEHPDHVFPHIADTGPFVQAEDLGHPLLGAQCVRNDIALGDPHRLWLVSGSNMSGKTTWLRTVGTAVLLSLVGAPVMARRCIVGPCHIGATLRIQDSLQRGTSRFYAEVLAIKRIVELARTGAPVLFLFDEMFHGTNSHDRAVGAQAVLQELLRHNTIGLVTTHDLALTEVVAQWAPAARNVHFADQLRDGRMTFDYRIKDGPVRHSNAVALMRSVGLTI